MFVERYSNYKLFCPAANATKPTVDVVFAKAPAEANLEWDDFGMQLHDARKPLKARRWYACCGVGVRPSCPTRHFGEAPVDPVSPFVVIPRGTAPSFATSCNCTEFFQHFAFSWLLLLIYWLLRGDLASF